MTRSAASISSGLALRPVTTTCRSGAPRRERRHDLVERQIVVAKRDVELVEHEQPDRRIGHHAPAPSAQAALGRGDVARAVLRLPGEALAHACATRPGRRSARSRCARRSDQAPLMNCTTPTRKPRPERPQHQPERGRRLALARPVWTISSPFSRWSWRRPRRPARPCAWPSWLCGGRSSGRFMRGTAQQSLSSEARPLSIGRRKGMRSSRGCPRNCSRRAARAHATGPAPEPGRRHEAPTRSQETCRHDELDHWRGDPQDASRILCDTEPLRHLPPRGDPLEAAGRARG